jgi:outer membrane protein OmpA-like peptidoglycan-associated protein/tetratricopeptide (TPR) repeat protein
MKPFFTIAFLFVLISNFYGQLTNEEIKQIILNSNENDLLKEGSRLMYEGFHYQAKMVMDKLIEFQPENPNYNYRIGFLLLEMKKDYKKAIPFLEKSIVKTKKNFDAFSIKEEYAPVDAHYYLGKCYHMDGKIELAEQQYKLFIDKSDAKSEILKLAQLGIIQCNNARVEIKNASKDSVINLGSDVNTAFEEYGGIISLDGSSLYFTSKRPWENDETEKFRDIRKGLLPEDIYVSQFNLNNNWSKGKRLDFCEAERNEASISLSVNERYIYIYQDSTGSGDVYFSDIYSQSFETISSFEKPKLNSEFWETHVMISNDGNTIIFASDRPGGYGGLDLYVMNKTNENWSKPENLGSNINTAFDEDAPFLSSNGKNLYFASNGPLSIGGFDILIANKNNDGSWGTTKNAGYPFNSTNDDIYFTSTIDGKRGFLTSSRPNGFGGTDLYEIRNEQFGISSNFNLVGKIINSNGNSLPKDYAVNMELKCVDCENTESIFIFPRLSDGIFMSLLEPCKNYQLSYFSSSTKKLLYQSNFKTDCSSSIDLIEKEVILDVNAQTIAPIYKIKGVITNAITLEKIPNAHIVVKLNSGEIVEDIIGSSDGSFKLNFLNAKKIGDNLNFQITISANGYLSKSINIEQKLGAEEIISLSFNLEKLNIGADLAKSFGVKSIYFDFNKYDLRNDAIKELDKIVKIMNDNPTLHIEFGAHTDCSGPEVYNQYLSDMRAESVENYIKSKITNPERISGKGFGEKEPLNKCSCDDLSNPCSASQNKANRRAVFKVIQK